MKRSDMQQPGKPGRSGDARGMSSTPAKSAVAATHGSVAHPQASNVTQSHRKAAQRLRDLLQNENFTSTLLTLLHNEKRVGGISKLDQFALEHYLDRRQIELLEQEILGEWPNLDDGDVDFCHVEDAGAQAFKAFERRVDLGAAWPDLDYEFSVIFSTALYPIHICISPLATQRDVLDWVRNKWSRTVAPSLYAYSGDVPRIRRRRKLKRDQFIWGHRELASGSIGTLVNKEFGESLDDEEVNSILAYMKKRYSGI
ncbi:MAG: hypothetical protein Q7V53_03205 [Caldisericota bacterium]|nr:hypothetical protein [Caldisericota bacterium]